MEEALEKQNTGKFALGEIPLFISSVPTGFSRVSEVVFEGWSFSKEMQETFGGMAELFDSRDGKKQNQRIVPESRKRYSGSSCNL